MSSADTTPISPSRFAAALKDLSIGMLHLKALEVRNSIAHLQYSNDQLRPFAEGSAVASDSTASSSGTTAQQEPDQDCVDAIRENEQVIDRMAERIALIRAEVEERGVSWSEFQTKGDVSENQHDSSPKVNGQHSAWTDGTFQTGTITNGQIHLEPQPSQPDGGRLSDQELRRAMEERMRDLSHNDDEVDADAGMHL